MLKGNNFGLNKIKCNNHKHLFNNNLNYRIINKKLKFKNNCYFNNNNNSK